MTWWQEVLVFVFAAVVGTPLCIAAACGIVIGVVKLMETRP